MDNTLGRYSTNGAQTETHKTEYMHYAGTQKALEATKNVSDGINGRMGLNEQDLSAIGATGGEKVKVHARANGMQTTYTKQMHSDGKAVTLPINQRKQLRLSPGDEIEWWVCLANEETPSTHRASKETLSPSDSTSSTTSSQDSSPTSSNTPSPSANEQSSPEITPNNPTPSSNSQTTTTSDETRGLKFEGEDLLHHVTGTSPTHTLCGTPLADKDYSITKRTSLDIIPTCNKCNPKTSAEMNTNALAKWIAEHSEISFADATTHLIDLPEPLLEKIRNRWLELMDTNNIHGTNNDHNA
jgi:hypothetical protein